MDNIQGNLSTSNLPTYVKINVLEALQEYEKNGNASVWENNEFVKFSWVISGLFGLKHNIIKLAKITNYDELTNGLKKLIHDKVKDLPEDLDMPILQSLLRDYSTGDDSKLKVYSEWLRIARERIKGL